MFEFHYIPPQYSYESVILDYIKARKNYDFYMYNNYSLQSKFEEYLEEATTFYTFYENNPDSGIETPEELNISEEDVIKYFHELKMIEIKSLSHLLKYNKPILSEIFKEKYGNKIDDIKIKSSIKDSFFIFFLFIIILLWIIWSYLIFSGFLGVGSFWYNFIMSIFFPFILFSFIGSGLLCAIIARLIIKNIYVYIHNEIVYYRCNKKFSSNKIKLDKVNLLRTKQIKYLILNGKELPKQTSTYYVFSK